MYELAHRRTHSGDRGETIANLLLDANTKYKPRLEFQKLTGLGKALGLHHLPSESPKLLWGQKRGKTHFDYFSKARASHLIRLLRHLGSCLETVIFTGAQVISQP